MAGERDPRCGFALDTEFLGLHGELGESLTADWLWSERRVQHVHLKDFNGRMRVDGKRRYLLPGEGDLHLQGFLSGLVERGYDGAVTIEATAINDEGALDPERLAQMAAVVAQLSS